MREKMPRINRAAQFAPFDALKGLSDALRLKEYEQEKTTAGEMTEEQAKKLSAILLSLEKGDSLSVKYFEDGHEKSVKGRVKTDLAQMLIIVCDKKIPLSLITDMEKV